MSKTVVKDKTVHYKKVDFLKGANLGNLLKAQLLDKDSFYHKAINRQQFVSATKDDFILINHASSHQSMFFGELIIVESGKAQAVLKIDNDSATEFPIKTYLTEDLPDDEDESVEVVRKEFIDSVLYFGVIDNHVAIIQSRSLTARTLESYLGWLLGEAAKALPANSALILKDAPNPAIKEKLESTPAKTISISSGIGSTELQPIHKIESNVPAKIDYKIEENVVDVLKTAFAVDLDDLKLEDGLDDANLKLKLTLTYNRKTSKSGQKVIDTVASSMRHNDDYVITLEDGTKVTADNLKMSGKISVETINNKVYNDGLKVQLYNWMTTNINFGD
ncbi:hypothetical protein [Acinetobacter baumannii]|uniref:hypothetical protein n=1 Tax=Acinetobacter baumannii TaxID=470 RepID=UPI00057F9982|nr:hypothetical protein [Acinetobacter baumannii]EKU0438987.1 hypothetical protein [Acinetobacter baumannii]EKU4519146.1 hypothetical protein [Acinetobacter baumannii]EKU9467669.1 hypothetical protein [Acinetobacter baumannii]EKU9582049.1 hypothetical protein [Acinetobacter baumannii]EKW2364291.1 hypothetical protein [Acinetobacter baumannii]